jgi:3-dehydroquinate synthase
MPELLKRKPAVLGKVIARCCEIKAEVVAEDETESGLRAILNFGHTVGHALEAISHYGKYLHGEAISLGQVAAVQLSSELRGLPQSEASRIVKLLENAGLPVSLRPSPAQRQNLLNAMRLDKKVSGGEVKFVLASKIGKVAYGQKVPASVLNKVLNSNVR